MKIRVEFEVVIDADEWAITYGADDVAASVEAIARRAIENMSIVPVVAL